jgi:hypothetical protein
MAGLRAILRFRSTGAEDSATVPGSAHQEAQASAASATPAQQQPSGKTSPAPPAQAAPGRGCQPGPVPAGPAAAHEAATKKTHAC